MVSGPTGALRAMSVTSTQVGYLLNTTSDIQAQLDAKQATIGDGDLTIARTNGLQAALDGKESSLSRTSIGSVTWSAGPQQTTIANVTALRGYIEIVPTLDQTALSASDRTIELTLQFSSLSETDMVIVPRFPVSNHASGALNITNVRPNSASNEVVIHCRSAANVNYQSNTNSADKFFVNYLILQ